MFPEFAMQLTCTGTPRLAATRPAGLMRRLHQEGDLSMYTAYIHAITPPPPADEPYYPIGSPGVITMQSSWRFAIGCMGRCNM
jgi:hypothetical protein